MGIGFWFIQKFTRGKSVETVKIRDNPIQIANNKSRIIGKPEFRFHTSKLLSSYRFWICGFINWGLGEFPSSTTVVLYFWWGGSHDL